MKYKACLLTVYPCRDIKLSGNIIACEDERVQPTYAHVMDNLCMCVCVCVCVCVCLHVIMKENARSMNGKHDKRYFKSVAASITHQ